MKDNAKNIELLLKRKMSDALNKGFLDEVGRDIGNLCVETLRKRKIPKTEVDEKRLEDNLGSLNDVKTDKLKNKKYISKKEALILEKEKLKLKEKTLKAAKEKAKMTERMFTAISAKVKSIVDKGSMKVFNIELSGGDAAQMKKAEGSLPTSGKQWISERRRIAKLVTDKLKEQFK